MHWLAEYDIVRKKWDAILVLFESRGISQSRPPSRHFSWNKILEDSQNSLCSYRKDSVKVKRAKSAFIYLSGFIKRYLFFKCVLASWPLRWIKSSCKSLGRAWKGQINRWQHTESRSWQKWQICNEMNNILRHRNYDLSVSQTLYEADSEMPD